MKNELDLDLVFERKKSYIIFSGYDFKNDICFTFTIVVKKKMKKKEKKNTKKHKHTKTITTKEKLLKQRNKNKTSKAVGHNGGPQSDDRQTLFRSI